MEISDIRIKLMQDAANRLKAVCSITLDDEFVVRDLKVVEGTNGLFVAMPSRKLSVHCPQCRNKNHLRARYCNECGAKLPAPRIPSDPAGRIRLHRDIAHPINPAFREIVQSHVIEKYQAELEFAQDPDYAPVDIDHDLEEAPEEPGGDLASGGDHAPSEYNQLIAGLRGGSEPSPVAESRPSRRNDSDGLGSPSPIRPAERRDSDRAPAAGPRPAPPQRGGPPRPALQRRDRDERPPGPPRDRGPSPAPQPAIVSFDCEEMDEERTPAPEARPVARVQPPVSRSEPTRAPSPAPPRTQAPPPKPQQPTNDSEDTPFGAGILSKGEN